MSFRIGFGYDVHQLIENRDFFLGGIQIPHSKGAIAHSDGDTLIHAICDAILGAAGSRDIGYHFPDNENKFKDIDSKVLLKDVLTLIRNEGYSIGNIDSTICLQQPKLGPYITEMQKTLCKILEIPEQDLSIKATTTERLGFVGTEDGIAVYAVVLLNKST